MNSLMIATKGHDFCLKSIKYWLNQAGWHCERAIYCSENLTRAADGHIAGMIRDIRFALSRCHDLREWEKKIKDFS